MKCAPNSAVSSPNSTLKTLRITASTDAHSVRGLGNMRLAIGTARRAGATAADVLNTRPLSEILQ